MKTLRCLAALPAFLLAACASVETAVVSTGGGPTRLCWKDSLIDDGKSLSCNWETSKSEACRSTNRTLLPKESVASGPENAGRCDNGQWLVRVTTK